MKTFIFPYYPYEKEDMLRFLNQKAKDGYLLVKVDFKDQCAVFKPTNKKNIYYDLTIHQDCGYLFEQHNQSTQEYFDSCALSGWEHLCSCDGVCFFYSTNNVFPLADPYTDQLSIADKKKEFRYYLMKKAKTSIFFIFMLILSALLENKMDLFDIYIITNGIFIIFIFLSLYYTNNITFRLNGLELMVSLITATALIASFHNMIIITIWILLCIFMFAYLSKVKFPPFLFSRPLNLLVRVLLICIFSIYLFS